MNQMRDFFQARFSQATTAVSSQAITDVSTLNGAVLFFASIAFFVAWQWFHSFNQTLLKVVWSDEGKAILGSSVFYPTVAMTILFIVARLVPNKVVKTCAFFCKRKALAAWKTIRMTIAQLQSMVAKIVAKRTQVWTSLRVVIGAFEIICL
jgi:hypothetical protein